MTLIAQTFAPSKSRIGRYDEAVATYQNLYQIGTPLVKRIVTSTGDNITQRSYLLKNTKIDRQPWEPYFYYTQLGLDVRKITLTDPSLRTVSYKNIKFDENNEPYALINQTGAPTVKRVVADNSNRITPIKILRFDENNEPYAITNKTGLPAVKRVVADNSNRIAPIKINSYFEVNEPYGITNQIGLPSVKRTVTNSGDNTAQRSLSLKNVKYYTISYMSYNDPIVQTGTYTRTVIGTTRISSTTLSPITWKNVRYDNTISYMSYNDPIVKTGTYTRTVIGTTRISGTTLAPVEKNSTAFSFTDSLYFTAYKVGITLSKFTVDSTLAALAPVNVNETTNFSITNNAYFYPYQIGVPFVQTRNIDAGQSSVSSRNSRYDQSIRAIYSDPPYQIGLPTAYKTTVTYSSAPVKINVLKYYPRTIEGPYYTMNKVGLAVGGGGGPTNYQFWS